MKKLAQLVKSSIESVEKWTKESGIMNIHQEQAYNKWTASNLPQKTKPPIEGVSDDFPYGVMATKDNTTVIRGANSVGKSYLPKEKV